MAEKPPDYVPLTADPSPPPPVLSSPEKKRIAFLDNVKLLCMVSVWVLHASVWASANCTLEHGGDEAWPEPEWKVRFVSFLHSYDMSIFAFCSGAVSYSEVTDSRLRAVFTQILLPTVLYSLWFTVWNMCMWGTDQAQYYNSFWTNPEPWYMKSLFVWRTALFMVGHLNDLSLMILAVIASSTFPYSSYPADELTSAFFTAAYDVPCFILGHILVRRNGLLEPYTQFLRKNKNLRAASFIATILLVVDALLWGHVHQLEYDHGLLENQNGLLRIPRTIVYGFIVTAWVPTGSIPFLSNAGRYTLYAYLLNYQVLLMLLGYCKTYIPGQGSNLWYASWLTISALTSILLCSEVSRFLFWPLAQPSWFEKGLENWEEKFQELNNVAMAQKVGHQVWLAIFLAFHFAFFYAASHIESWRPCIH